MTKSKGENMRVTLIYPAIEKKPGKSYLRSWQMEPLAIAVIAGLTPDDVEIKFYDDRIEDIPFSEHTDLVGISVETYSAKRAYEISAKFRSQNIPVVLGGYHPTLVPEEATKHCDAVVVGSAEGLWEQVINDVQNGTLQKIYKTDSMKTVFFSTPKRNVFVGKNYLPISLLEAGRGCQFKCEFCSITTYHQNNFFRRPINEIVSEIRQLKNKLLFFVDDNIIGDIVSAKELFRALIPEKISWVSQCSTNICRDDELIQLMAQSGCKGVLIGFESLNLENLKQMGKTHNKILEYEMTLTKLREYGIVVYGAFVLGYDQDDNSSAIKTVEFGMRQNLFIAAFNHLVPFPGTPLYKRFQKEGRLIRDSWWLDSGFQFGDICYFPKKVKPNELTVICMNARKRFFKFSSIIKRGLDLKANCKSLSMAKMFFFANFLLKREINKRRDVRLGSR